MGGPRITRAPSGLWSSAGGTPAVPGLCAQLLRELRPLIARRHLESEVEGGQILARVVVREGELRDAEIVRPRLGAFVDAGVEIDIVHAGRAGCPHDDLDIALAVEGANIAGVAVVVDDVVEVGSLGPADALEMDGEGRPGRSAGHVHGQGGRLDPIGPDLFLSPGIDPQAVGAAEIIGRCETEFRSSGAVRPAFRDGLCYFLPT